MHKAKDKKTNIVFLKVFLKVQVPDQALESLILGKDQGGLDTFNICTPKLSTLTITDPDTFPKVFNVIAPQLQNLTASFNTSMKLRSHRAFYSDSFKFLQFSTEGLDSLQKVNLSLPWSLYEDEIYAPQLLDLFRKLHSAKFLILDTSIIEQKDRISRMPTQVRNYLLESSPSATFVTELPQVQQKRSRHEVDKGTMAKKLANSKEEKQQSKTMIEEYRSRSRKETLYQEFPLKSETTCLKALQVPLPS
ncbi:hypothetical protein OSB04_un000524 [Centaurea solstitialis]|uniref:Uncharacterized protein n=1 Tax=Centaurea solstitialis TaxID=347529 RepID=A0AA38W2J8_9ASTR|nr:hypothetical protein OSB04_un000524 [Centaurea solstitialis]